MQRNKLSHFLEKKDTFIIDANKNVHDALKLLNKSKIKTLIVIKNKNTDSEFCGTVTDGDIRRFLIKKINLETKIKYLCNKNSKFLYIHEKNFIKKISSIYHNLLINYIPILSKKKKYLGYLDAKQVLEKFKYFKKIKKFDVFIMAGGFGKRLRPLTYKTPKPLIDINGSSIISRILASIPIDKIDNIFISLHYKAGQIKNHINKNYNNNNKITFFHEKKPLGTAGSLFQLKKIKTNENFLLINADLFSNVDFNSFFNFHLNYKSDFTVCSSNYKIDVPYGVITNIGNKIKKITEKPRINLQINSGIYFFNKKIINSIKNNFFLSATNLILILIKKKYKILHYPIYEQWIDIGNVEDLKKATSFLK
jgi:NDP-sugar pyrophosphorylase family protein